jgi:hypothetical protein
MSLLYFTRWFSAGAPIDFIVKNQADIDVFLRQKECERIFCHFRNVIRDHCSSTKPGTIDALLTIRMVYHPRLKSKSAHEMEQLLKGFVIDVRGESSPEISPSSP